MKTKKIIAMLLMLLLFVIALPVHAASIKMNVSSATIQVEDTVQLEVLKDGVPQTAVWGSVDETVATVSQQGLVTGKAAGSSLIRAVVDGNTVECLVSVVTRTTNKNTRYNVLILDASGSMKGTPLKREKSAAKRFCKAVLSSEGNNYLAVVTLNGSPKVVCSFTKSRSKLEKAIDKVKASGGTNMNAAFKKAGNLLKAKKSGSGILKNIILCSDGIPKDGTKKSSGRYSSSNHKYYKYANAVYKTDTALKKKGYFVYALGFFHNSKGKDLTFGKKLMKDLASKDKYFIVNKVNDMDNVFTNIAADINDITLNARSLSLYEGETYNLDVIVNGKNQAASWKSSRKSVATVNSAGLVSAKTAGTAIITGTENGQKVTCNVTVKTAPASITLNESSIEIYVGDSIKVKTEVTGKSKTVTWSSDKETVAAVKSGTITGVAPGTAIITAKANGKKATCTVTVKKKIDGPIYTVEDLKNVANNLDGTYNLMNDLDLSGLEWNPLGSSDEPFTGEFYGNGHTISNLTITTAEDIQGLFGYTEGAYIYGLEVTGKVIGGTYTGGIVGRLTGKSTIAYCINRASVTGSGQIGGIVGRVSDSTIDHCLNYSMITTKGRGCGGITADIYRYGTISNCVNMADITGGSDITGGIVGGSTYGTVTGCYNAGNVASGYRSGAIAGDNAGYAGTRSNNYFLKTDVINAKYNPIGTGSGTFGSLQDAGLQSAIAEITSKF